MAKVTFVQIGNSSMPKQTYTDKLNLALSQYPGAIIFGTYYDNDKKKECQEIWANGKQYSVGAGSDARFYEGNVRPEVYFAEHQDITPLHGDYYIQNSALDPSTYDNQHLDSDTGLPVQRKTAYVYDSTITNNHNEVTGGWVVLDGNVSADNVYFPNGIRHNQAWGRINSLTTSEVDWKGFNLAHIMKDVLLVSGPVPTVTPHDNHGTDPSVTVSTPDEAVTLTVYDASTGGNVVTSGSWFYVGKRLYIPKDTSITYTGYNLTLTSSDTSVKEGGASLTGMTYGYWDSSTNIGKQEEIIESSTIVGNPVYANVTHYSNQTDGNCRLKLTTSNITYNKPENAIDDVSTSQPSTQPSLSLTSNSEDRIFIVQESTEGTITLTGTNGNHWKATRDAYDIPKVGPVWVANNEYDKNAEVSHDPSSVNAATLTSTNRSGKSKSITVKGYYPVYSNIKKSSYTAATEEINNTNKSSYSWDINTGWASGGTSSATDAYPVIIEYPRSKSISITLGTESYTPTEIDNTITKTIEGNTVNYTQVKISISFAKGLRVRFSLT